MVMESPAKKPKLELLEAVTRTLKPEELLFGAIWIGPGGDNNGQDLGQENADATVAAAVSSGIVEFDTAPWYGAGCAEERLGRAVAKLPSGNANIYTKTGRLIFGTDGTTPCTVSFEAVGAPKWNERVIKNDYTAHGSAASLSHSLARMTLSGVYGLRIHDPNDNSNFDGTVDEVAVALGDDGMISGLRKLRDDGLIRHVSLGMNCNKEAHMGAPDEVVRLIQGAPEGTFDSAMLAGGWNLLSQKGLPCLLECQRRGIPVHVAGIFASGLLVGVNRYAYKPAPPEILEKAEQWRTLASKHGVSLPAVAMAFAALPSIVSRVVVGMSSPQQVEQSISTLTESAKVPKEIWKQAKEIGLLDSDVPVPQ